MTMSRRSKHYCAVTVSLLLASFAFSITAGEKAVLPKSGASDGRLTSARLIKRVEPQFPDHAKKTGIRNAEVHAQFKIDKEGRPLDVEIIECSHPDVGFEAAAIRAIKQWRYEPALMDDKPIEVYEAVTLRFSQDKEAQSG